MKLKTALQENAEYWDVDEEVNCTWCGGEGWTQCNDPIQCLDPACDGQYCTCEACHGRGYGQSVW